MENNKLIAEFMGNIPIFENEYQMVTHNNMCYGIDELKYDTDWNWLMPVVERIESLGIVVEIRENVCYIETSLGNYSELEDTKLQATYKAVVKFINWYNECI
jgi:hypothetical protein